MERTHIFRLIILVVLMCLTSRSLISQPTSDPVYVIVHGAWGGGWAFKKVDALLTEKGHTVYRPTLTGQGERVHLATQDVDLKTHITDVVNTILFEELTNIILVGHSYGGMVVTGVADAVPERIHKLIYLDAFVPEDQESVLSITGNDRAFNVTDGYVVPSWLKEGQTPPMDVPHPYKTLSDTIYLTNPARQNLPTSYILTVEKGTNAKDDGFAAQAERASKKGWPLFQLQADHNPQWSAPEAFVQLLIDMTSD